MEEANERLVRLYLESKGFFVRTNYHVNIGKNRTLEADIVALRIRNKDRDELPNAIMAEVKSWPLSITDIDALYNRSDSNIKKERQKQNASRLKLVNNKKDRIIFFQKLKKEFGVDFRFALICKNYTQKYKKIFEKYFKKEKIIFIDMKRIVQGVVDYAKQATYSNDSDLQIVRRMNEFDDKEDN